MSKPTPPTPQQILDALAPEFSRSFSVFLEGYMITSGLTPSELKQGEPMGIPIAFKTSQIPLLLSAIAFLTVNSVRSIDQIRKMLDFEDIKKATEAAGHKWETSKGHRLEEFLELWGMSMVHTTSLILDAGLAQVAEFEKEDMEALAKAATSPLSN